MRNKGTHKARVLSVGGELELSRRYFWAAKLGGWCPADEALGIQQSRVSAGAREVLCRMGMVQDFADAAEDARRIGNVPVSKERLRQVVEAEGTAVTATRTQGKLPAAWTAADAKVAGTNKTRIYAGLDGVMAPMVGHAEKCKRRKQQVARRKQRTRRGVKNTKPLPPMKAGHKDKYREMKIGVFYDQDKTHRHVFATAQRWRGFAGLMKIHARQVELEKADESYTLSDGANWVLSVICLVLAMVKMTLLDFYHLSQHMYEGAHACLGETPQALAWAKARLTEIKEQGAGPVLAAIAELKRKVRSPAKRKQLRRLENYLRKRLEMLDYKGALAQGLDIGSGPTEATCKTLTLRLKRPGMKWDAPNAEAIMNLVALYESGQKKAYWDMRKAA